MCRKKNFSTGNWRTLWKDFFPQPIHPHSTAPVDTRRVAADNFARLLSTIRYFPDPPGIVLCAMPDFLYLPIDSVGKKHPEKSKPKRGQGQSIRNPSQSEGSIKRWLGGILKGKTPNGSELFSPCNAGFSLSSNRQRGKEAPRKEQTKTGAGAIDSQPEPKRRVNQTMVRGDS